MSKTREYLAALKKQYNIQSDYALAKLLAVPRGNISNYQLGKSNFEDDMCIKVAGLLRLDPVKVIADVHADRAKKDSERQFWRQLAKRVPNLAAGFMAFAVIPALLTVRDAAQCILCKIGTIGRNLTPRAYPTQKFLPHRAIVALV